MRWCNQIRVLQSNQSVTIKSAADASHQAHDTLTGANRAVIGAAAQMGTANHGGDAGINAASLHHHAPAPEKGRTREARIRMCARASQAAAIFGNKIRFRESYSSTLTARSKLTSVARCRSFSPHPPPRLMNKMKREREEREEHATNAC